ncbi:hypothetical protein Kpho02_59860 [Kitasatospora phosalacinea]|uniref:Uncharacterized protein n=1 Tax=Kitasatospora phosalacinea TaxID=2065 RepID=A0A9W6QF29_9ACTN|nr:hypothetical protein [Kitasatospora phosalacinea]GLW73688.1 hypothetical protein Kpho02_59860 [Kitasatospora phosalacinea]
MLDRLRHFVSDTVTEVQDHRRFTRDIKQQVADGDRDAAEAFRTGTLAAALTRRGRDARGREVVAYVQQVLDADGRPDRIGWLHRR